MLCTINSLLFSAHRPALPNRRSDKGNLAVSLPRREPAEQEKAKSRRAISDGKAALRLTVLERSAACVLPTSRTCKHLLAGFARSLRIDLAIVALLSRLLAVCAMRARVRSLQAIKGQKSVPLGRTHAWLLQPRHLTRKLAC